MSMILSIFPLQINYTRIFKNTQPVTSGAVWAFYENGNDYITIPCSYKGSIALRKSGKVVQVRFLQSDNSTFDFGTENQWNVIATIPQGFRPWGTIFLTDQGEGNCFFDQIFADGNVYSYKRSGINPGWEIAFNVAYVMS